MSQPDVSMATLAQLTSMVEHFDRARVMCVGDVMLDRFVYGSVERISPEAPIPVMRQQHVKSMLGGAGNVLRNLCSLGASCCFISVIGDDAAGREVTGLIGQQAGAEPYLVTQAGRMTTEKTRFVSGQQQLLRCDHEERGPVSEAVRDRMLQIASKEISHVELLVLSDYGKGVLEDGMVRSLVEMARALKIPVLIDPKRSDYEPYRGATMVCPNLHELALAAGVSGFADLIAIEAAARMLMSRYDIAYLLVTRGKDGMSLIGPDTQTFHIPAQARDVFDVSGAGDTVMATLAAGMASGLAVADAARIANIAAGIVVGKPGTATIYRTDLKTHLYTQESVRSQSKLVAQATAVAVAEGWREQGLSVGFTNGCFDVLHVGHLASLQAAKQQCDRLIIAINSDDSVRRLKGESRPINTEMDRAMLLAALDPVDMVVIFREDTPMNLIVTIKPDVLMKGADYTVETVVGAKEVMAYGGRVALLPIEEGYSTTATLKKAQA